MGSVCCKKCTSSEDQPHQQASGANKQENEQQCKSSFQSPDESKRVLEIDETRAKENVSTNTPRLLISELRAENLAFETSENLKAAEGVSVSSPANNSSLLANNNKSFVNKKKKMIDFPQTNNLKPEINSNPIGSFTLGSQGANKQKNEQQCKSSFLSPDRSEQVLEMDKTRAKENVSNNTPRLLLRELKAENLTFEKSGNLEAAEGISVSSSANNSGLLANDNKFSVNKNTMIDFPPTNNIQIKPIGSLTLENETTKKKLILEGTNHSPSNERKSYKKTTNLDHKKDISRNIYMMPQKRTSKTFYNSTFLNDGDSFINESQSTTNNYNSFQNLSIYDLKPSSAESEKRKLYQINNITIDRPETSFMIHDVQQYIVNNVYKLKPSLPVLNKDYSLRCDRHTLKVCQTYNQLKFHCLCHCHRFHVCLGWIRGLCNNQNCKVDHSFQSKHNQILAKHFIKLNYSEDDLKNDLLNNFNYGLRNKSRYKEPNTPICPFNLRGKCKKQNCDMLHISRTYVWEVLDDTWVRFTDKQMQEIEKSYCDPTIDRINIATVKKRSNQMKHIRKIFGDQGNAIIDFEKMVLHVSYQNATYCVRRLSTPSDINSNFAGFCRWNWYIKFGESWDYIRQGSTPSFHHISLSDFLERQLHCGKIEVVVEGSIFNLIDKSLRSPKHNIYQLKRRPVRMFCHEECSRERSTFTALWKPIDPETTIYERHRIGSSSYEFLFVESMINASFSPTIIDIDRIQNHMLWNSYQIRKKEVIEHRGWSEKNILEQYLFHGTNLENIDNICLQNFNPNLSGIKVGHKYGHGCYFTNDASIANCYSSGDVRLMFVVMVLVGNTFKGHRDLFLSPHSRNECQNYDTSVDSVEKPEIFAKFRNDEYYPAYCIKYEWK